MYFLITGLECGKTAALFLYLNVFTGQQFILQYQIQNELNQPLERISRPISFVMLL